MNAIDLVIISVCVALAGSLAAMTIPGVVGRAASFAALLCAGAFACAAGIAGLLERADSIGGYPDLHLVLRVDAISGFFLAVVGAIAVLCGLYGMTAKTSDERRSGRSAGSAACLILLSSVAACAAGDVLLFIFAWELLALSFFWAIAFTGTEEDAPKAAYFTLVITHVAGAALLAGLLVLAHAANSFDVARITPAASLLGGAGASIVFVLLLIGFGAKFGMLPMQAWLSYGYKSAPSVVAALMAGGALNVGFYGVARFVVPLGGSIPQWWPIVLLVAGALSAVYGITLAAAERDLRTLAANSSVENAGVILVAFGVAMCGRAVGDQMLYGLGIVAAFLQIVAHALAKCTLFLSASSLRDRCGTTSLERLGGLAKRMPITLIAILASSLSLAALPPLAGFCAEWLVLESMMQAFRTGSVALETALAVCGALVGLAAGIAVVAFVKAVGSTMLGAARGDGAATATEVPGILRRGALLVGAAAILFAGLLSRNLVALFAPAVHEFGNSSAASAVLAKPYLIQPAFPGFSSIAPVGLLGLIGGFALLFWVLTKFAARPATRVAPTWTSGERYYAWTQYTGTGFANPTRVILDALTRTVRSLDADTYESASRPFFDIDWYERIAGVFLRISNVVTKTQSGVIAAYLAYILGFTILLLLLLPSIRHW